MLDTYLQDVPGADIDEPFIWPTELAPDEGLLPVESAGVGDTTLPPDVTMEDLLNTDFSDFTGPRLQGSDELIGPQVEPATATQPLTAPSLDFNLDPDVSHVSDQPPVPSTAAGTESLDPLFTEDLTLPATMDLTAPFSYPWANTAVANPYSRPTSPTNFSTTIDQGLPDLSTILSQPPLPPITGSNEMLPAFSATLPQPCISPVTGSDIQAGSTPLVPTKPSLVPTKPWIRINSTTQGKNRRSAKIETFDAGRVYQQLPSAPDAWSDFRYTREGELAEAETYSVAQMRNYLLNHPLNTHRPDGENRLRLWIQRSPADSARRYPTSTSSRCRFAACFANGHRILAGHYRVCFDEQSWSRQNIDPYTNAGYVHLFCLEKLMDLPQLIRHCNFIADNRTLPSEPVGVNRMSLGGGTVFRTAQRFISGCRENSMPTFIARFMRGLKQKGHDLTVDGTLTQLLNIAKLIEEPQTRARQREQRGTSTSLFDHHLGNLIKMNKKKGQKRTLPLDDSGDDSSEKTVVAPAEPEQQPAEEPRTKKRKLSKNQERDKAGALVAPAEPEQQRAEEAQTKKRMLAENSEQDNEAARTIAEIAFRRLFKGNLPQRRSRSSSVASRHLRNPPDSSISSTPPASASSSPPPQADVAVPSIEPIEVISSSPQREERESAPSPSPHAAGFAHAVSIPSTRRSSATNSLFSLGGRSQRSIKTERTDEDDDVDENRRGSKKRHRVLGGCSRFSLKTECIDEDDLEMDESRRGRKKRRRI